MSTPYLPSWGILEENEQETEEVKSVCVCVCVCVHKI